MIDGDTMEKEGKKEKKDERGLPIIKRYAISTPARDPFENKDEEEEA
ncbi:hypothetical protein IPA_06755 [Ignicoccus pacificus DSM 13166]|uniref:Uncharacterized protein n=1 Tax=Ignicoccus pacificus DSM 13166 TaxID=940294 RepID=A0A977PK92_9CREN|nr:hypothetical protein IPA_06755 [Ignicoccus pacificus DSM 13166]